MTPKISTLANGLRIATLHMPGLETAAIGLYIDAGARSETEAQNGIAHVLEHLVFKGTAKRNARQIAEDIEDVGGHLNAYTTRDHTAYYARILASDLALGIDMIADLVTKPNLDQQDLTKEKEVILQELGQALDTPDDIIFDHLSDVAYPDQAMGRPIIGNADTIKSFNADSVRAWQKHHYHAGSMVLAAAGKVDHAALVKLADAALGGIASGTRPEPEAARYVGGERRDVRDLEQVHIALAIPACTYTSPDYYAQMLFSVMLGGGMSSRLFQEVREERGLVYSISCSLSPYTDTGLFSIYLATGHENARQAVIVTLETWAKATRGITEKEVQRAKAQAKAGLFMSMESCAGLSETLGRQMLIFGRMIPTPEIIAAIDACTAEQVMQVAQEMLKSGPLSMAIVGPETDVPCVGELQKRLI